MPGYSGRAMVKGAFRQPNTSSEPLLDLELVCTTRFEPIEMGTSIQYKDGKSSRGSELWINERMTSHVRSACRR